MSIIQPEVPAPEVTPEATPVALASFKGRLAQRRRELEQEQNFTLEVPGYPGLYAQYRILGYEDMRTIGLRVEEQTKSQVEGERLNAAETLTEACLGLMEHKGEDEGGRPVFESLGYRWTPAAARDLFEVQLPEGVGGRDALLAVFPYPRDMLMMAHYQEYLERAAKGIPAVDRILSGESPAPSGATSSS